MATATEGREGSEGIYGARSSAAADNVVKAVPLAKDAKELVERISGESVNAFGLSKLAAEFHLLSVKIVAEVAKTPEFEGYLTAIAIQALNGKIKLDKSQWKAMDWLKAKQTKPVKPQGRSHKEDPIDVEAES